MYLLSFLASLGVINGFIVSVFLLVKKQRKIPEMYFAALILSLCIRIGKSVFFYFSPETDRLILQIGLSACIFIGPFFYFYVKSLRKQEKRFTKENKQLLIVLFLLILATDIIYPYRTYPEYWNPEIVQGIYIVWMLFFILGIREVIKLVGQNILNFKKLRNEQQYLIIVTFGFTLITLTYQLALHISFTYIWGAFIFSFFFYALSIRALSNGKSITPRPSPTSRIKDDALLGQVNQLMIDEKLYTDQNLKLDDIARRLNVSRHVLSQTLNEVYSGYTRYIKNYRIEEAKVLIKKPTGSKS